MAQPPRTLHQFFDGRRNDRGQLPADERVRGTVLRAIREETPDLKVGESYRIRATAGDLGFRTQPEDEAVEIRASFYGAFWDDHGPWLIFQEAGQVGFYFKCLVNRVREHAVGIEGAGIRWLRES